MVFSKNEIRLLCQTPKLCYCETRVVRTIAMFIASQQFLVFNISDSCWKSSHNLWTLPNHNSRSLEGLGFQACHSASAEFPTTPFRKPSVLGDRDDRIVHFLYPILSCFWKMISVSDPNPVLVEIILSVSENYLKVYCDAQHTFLCCVYFASWGKITAGAILPLAKHDCLK